MEFCLSAILRSDDASRVVVVLAIASLLLARPAIAVELPRLAAPSAIASRVRQRALGTVVVLAHAALAVERGRLTVAVATSRTSAAAVASRPVVVLADAAIAVQP